MINDYTSMGLPEGRLFQAGVISQKGAELPLALFMGLKNQPALKLMKTSIPLSLEPPLTIKSASTNNPTAYTTVAGTWSEQ
jgi:hypothetical protein